MSRLGSNEAGALPGARVLVLVLGAALAFSGAELNALEQTSEPNHAGVAHHALADLERAFWACDHAATTHGMLDVGAAVACAEVTRDFRSRKFGGDFDAMLNWWRRNKGRQHHLLDMRHRAAGQR